MSIVYTTDVVCNKCGTNLWVNESEKFTGIRDARNFAKNLGWTVKKWTVKKLNDRLVDLCSDCSESHEGERDE